MTKLLVALGAFIILGFAGWFALDRHDKNLIDRAMSVQKVAGHDSTEADLSEQSDSIRTVFVNQKVPYVVYRDRVIQEHPTDTTVRRFVNACQLVISTCEQRHGVDSARISNLQQEVKTLKDSKSQKAARSSAFITGGMDFIASQPLIQAGGEVRVMGPLHLTASLLASRRNNQNDIDTKGILALTFRFR